MLHELIVLLYLDKLPGGVVLHELIVLLYLDKLPGGVVLHQLIAVLYLDKLPGGVVLYQLIVILYPDKLPGRVVLHELIAEAGDVEDGGDCLPLPGILQQGDVVLQLPIHQGHHLPVLTRQRHLGN